MKILILGAGPTGLGAASRLHALGHADWELWEREAIPGGLSRSVVDAHGFTWDLGGHVQFSHYKTFDEAMDRALGAEGWLHHQRESWIRIFGSWVPYPFQYNIHRLPPEETLRCLKGLLALQERGGRTGRFANFGELIQGSFGEGIAELFMVPYNRKVWGYPPEMLSTEWIGERVALPDAGRIIESVVLKQDQVSWGPNQTFRFAERGGTGAAWKAIAAALPQEKLHYGREAAGIDPACRIVRDAQGRESRYDALITTIPVDHLTALGEFGELRREAAALRHSSVHIIGVALTGQPLPDLLSKYWMYFPEPATPFFRVTVFSSYSPNNVPDPGRTWSLMAEVTETPEAPRDAERVIEETVAGLLREGMIASRQQVHHTWHTLAPYAYPTPALGRDGALKRLLPALEEMGIYSRGRFGAWRYEVSNQDHSMMQGVEVVNRILFGAPELTLWFPEVVNSPHPAYGKNWL